MSQQYQQYPQQVTPPQSMPPQATPPPQAPKRRRWLPWAAVAGASGAFVLGVVVGSAGGNSTTPTASTKPQPTVTVTTTAAAPVAEATAPPEETTPTYSAPTKNDFKLAIKVLSKQCFGSAGCNVSYRIILATYTGPELDPSETYEVTYVVRGGEDGPVTNTFSVTGDESSVDSEESVSTKSKDSKLTVVVSDVA